VQTPDHSPAQLARRVFDETLAAMDAGRAVERAVRMEAGRLHILDDEFDLTNEESDLIDGGRAVYAVALGKAAGPMAAALDRILGRRLAGGVLSAPPLSNDLSARLPARWQVFAGGHPLPNEASLAAARACFDLLRRADDQAALLIFLVSGGGSAMLEWPRDPAVTLEELREANRVLVACGAPIAEVNAVRRAISAIKGGGLARLAPRASQITLVVSDTREGEEYAVASGPTLTPPAGRDTPDARGVVERYGLAARLPASILSAIERHADQDGSRESARDEETSTGRTSGEKQAPDGPSAEVSHTPKRDFDRPRRPRNSRVLRRQHVLLSNALAVERAAEAARALGSAVEVARDITDQHVAEGARLLVSRLLELRARAGDESPVCLVSGGEFACPVRGAGSGGRSSETALRCALELEARGLSDPRAGGQPRLALLFAGTDGLDGNSPAAGALCDETTLARARALNLDPQKFLAASASHTFFDALGDAIRTGRTGTNVRDLRVLVSGER
jgi:hydroxypyruvate reductase